MKNGLGKKIFESYLSILPIAGTITILFLCGTVKSLTSQSLVAFLLSALAIGLGLTLFNLGCDNSISQMGTLIGSSLFKSRKVFLIGSMTFLLGVLITVAEPDLKIMAAQTGFDETTLIIVVSVGVGLFFLFGVLRILFKKSLQIMFLGFYGFIFAFAALLNKNYIPLSFDSGAVVTGPLTIPFILSFGAALALTRSENGPSGEDAFGLTALVTAGPIVSVMILSYFQSDEALIYKWDPSPFATVTEWNDFWPLLGNQAGSYLLTELKNMAIAILPLFAFFLIYNFIFLHLRKKALLKIFVSLIYSYLGMVIFLAAVMTGFLPIAQQIGYEVGSDPNLYPLALLLGGLFGLFGVLAEPAVHVLVKQIEKVSEGGIKSRTVLATMALSIGGGMVLAIVRAHYGFSILYYFIPIYALALGLSFFVPKIYANIAFDSGSIASGPMAASFVMPFVIGYAYAGDPDSVYFSAFGTIAMISAMPLVVIQLLGAFVEIKKRYIAHRVRVRFQEEDSDEIFYFDPA
jgi:hypothetical protein